jgi:Tfp pilus assembly protein FimT
MELVVVIAIIAILSAFVVPAVKSIKQSAQKMNDVSHLKKSPPPIVNIPWNVAMEQ